MKAGLSDWMRRTEVYEPKKDRDRFLSVTILQMFRVLRKIRTAGRTDQKGICAPLKFFSVVYLILLTSLARNMMFVWFMLALMLILAAVQPSDVMLGIVEAAFFGALFSALLLLPAVFLGSPGTMIAVLAKVFFSVAAVRWMALTTPWNRLTAAMRLFFVPDMFLFILDITVKYIVLLGEVSVQMLAALTLRSVGKNRAKNRSLSGIPGTAFLKSQSLAEQMHGAMQCRGFRGEYRRSFREKPGKRDLAAVLFLPAVTALFCYLEWTIRRGQ